MNQSVPISSTLQLSPEERSKLIEQMAELPRGIRLMLSDPKTGAYIRGLTKQHDFPLEQAPPIALAVFRVGIGEKTLAELPAILSTELKIANDKAQAIAREIERDLFAPVSRELAQVREKRNEKQENRTTTTGGVANVLDLKKQTHRPAPPPIQGRK